jgi:hypothetical protein
MKQIGRLLVALTCASVILGTAACGSTDVHSAATTAAPAPASGSSAADGCTDLKGTVAAEQTCHIKSSGKNYRVEMSYPLDYPERGAVTDFVRHQRDDFVNLVGSSYVRPAPYSLEIAGEEYRSGTTESGTQSVVFTINDDTGAAHEAHPDTLYQAFNYDLGKHAPITLDTLFKPGAQPLQVLSPIVEPQLVKRWGPAVLDPLHDAGANAYRNFAITDDAVIFFFGEDQLIPQNNGPMKVTVPRSQLQSILV